MESKTRVMLVTVMIVMVMGDLLIQTEAQFPTCLSCFVTCPFEQGFPGALMCPIECFMKCLAPPHSEMSLTDNTNHNDYYCKLGCATHHCSPLYSPKNPNVDKIGECMGSCSDKCSAKN